MEKGVLYYAGYLLGFLWIFVWVPFAGYNLGYAVRTFFACARDKARPKKDPIPPQEKRPKRTSTPTKPKKAKESKFSVVDSYDEEYKITNPVDFVPR